MIVDLLIKEVKEPTKETDVEMGKRGDTFEETVTDQRFTQMILKEVLSRLKEVYLLQKGQTLAVLAS